VYVPNTLTFVGVRCFICRCVINFPLNRRRREKRDFLIMRYYEKRLRNFHSKMYGYVNCSVFLQKWKFQVSTLSGFKVMIQNVHVQFLFCNSIDQESKYTKYIIILLPIKLTLELMIYPILNTVLKKPSNLTFILWGGGCYRKQTNYFTAKSTACTQTVNTSTHLVRVFLWWSTCFLWTAYDKVLIFIIAHIKCLVPIL